MQKYVGQIESPELTLKAYFKLGKEKSYVVKMYKMDMTIIKEDSVIKHSL